jgi:hypothetical protein
MIKMNILLAIFRARNEKILILQIKGEAHINSAMQGQSPMATWQAAASRRGCQRNSQ